MLMSSSTSFLISIYVTNKEGGACSMKINAQTSAAEVVEFVTTTKNLPKRNYALFLVLGDAESGKREREGGKGKILLFICLFIYYRASITFT